MKRQRPPYYELHVTFVDDPLLRTIHQQCVKAYGWSYSRIDGDPLLGDGVKAYATTHLSARRHKREEAEARVLACGNYMVSHKAQVLREKVELVIFDKVEK